MRIGLIPIGDMPGTPRSSCFGSISPPEWRPAFAQQKSRVAGISWIFRQPGCLGETL